MTGYPPEPWRLRGQAYVALWSVPSRRLPDPAPAGLRPVVAGGRAVLATAWLDYQPGGVLAYRELLAAVLVRDGVRPLVTITDIWVDSPASLAGGRELWGIPKELARFELTAQAALADTGAGRIAAADLRRGAGLPVRLPARFTVAQARPDGGVLRTPVRATGHLHAATVRWRIEADGPLGHLHGLRPVATFALRDFRMRFGPRRPERGATRPGDDRLGRYAGGALGVRD